MGIRHSKKSVDIASSPKKNGTAPEAEVKVKDLPEETATKEEAKEETPAVEEKPANGDAPAEQTQIEEVSTEEEASCRGEYRRGGFRLKIRKGGGS